MYKHNIVIGRIFRPTKSFLAQCRCFSYIKAFDGELKVNELGTSIKSDKGNGDVSREILYLNASGTDERSFTSHAFRAFHDEYRRHNPTDVFTNVDLWGSDLVRYNLSHVQSKIRMLKGIGSEEDREKFRPIKEMIDQLLSCDKLVVSSPMWNFTVPYILKQYIDIVVQPGVTFKETPDGPVGLVRGKRLLLITSSGGDYSEPPMKDYDFLVPYLKHIFGLIGFTEILHINIGNTANISRESILAKIFVMASETARTF